MTSHPLKSLAPELHGRRCVVVSGLPGTGKSLLVRETAHLAIDEGRDVCLLQWDVARTAWDTPEILARFPEIDGVTHAGIRKALGFWIRKVIANWFEQHPNDDELLIVEAPIIGGRFAELARRMDDAVEARLVSSETLFIVIAPTTRLQAALRERRASEARQGGHGLERHNATVAVLDAQVREVERVAALMGISPSSRASYDSTSYEAVMKSVLKHRHLLVHRSDTVIDAPGSVYDLGVKIGRIGPSPADVAETIERVATLSPDQLRQEVELDWAFT